MPSSPFARTASSDPLIVANTALYRRLFAEPWGDRPSAVPWGHASVISPRHRRQYDRMRRIVDRLVPARGGTFLDISAGNATLSLPLAARFGTAVFADLMVDAVEWLSRQPGALVVRADYLAPPYRPGAFDYILCTDTLIYGTDHESALLGVIWNTLAPGGTALLQFHHRRHHLPWRRRWLCGYTRREIETMLLALQPRPELSVQPFFQEFAGNLETGPAAAIAKRIFPATRFFVLARKPARGPS
jgi:SAM-dependent methyltransferase